MNYLIVKTRSEHPTLYLMQKQEYIEVQRACEKYSQLHEFSLHIFKLQVIPHQDFSLNPPGAVLLSKEGAVFCSNPVENYVNLASAELDKLPREQALQELQRSLDYFDKLRLRLEAKEEIPTGS